MTAADLSLTVAWFGRAILEGRPAIGDPERTTWSNFAEVFLWRREGLKDGPNFVPARFKLEPDGRHVRRLKRNLLARTAIALDCETNKATGEIPPTVTEAVARIVAMGWAGVVYTSHNHQTQAPRYRIVLPLSGEIDHELPAPEFAGSALRLRGVLDESKLGASSLFYLPSCDIDREDDHETVVIDGAALDAAWVKERAGSILAAREAEKERQARAAHAEAAARREAKIAAGFDPDDSLIERLRAHFDLAGVLLAHGYDRSGSKFRHPNSTSGGYGADIKALGGIERVFSHNATDPLHASNLPAWCGGVTALDAIDVVAILDFAGDRTKALHQLAGRFGLTKTAERGAVAAVIFRMLRRQASQHEIEAAAFAEGSRQGLTRAEVCEVARWVASTAADRAAA